MRLEKRQVKGDVTLGYKITNGLKERREGNGDKCHKCILPIMELLVFSLGIQQLR